MSLNDAFYQDLATKGDALFPSQQDLASQRGILGQAVAATGRAGLNLAQMPVDALSAVPGLRATMQPASEWLEQQKPLSSGKGFESGLEMGLTSVGMATATGLTMGPVGAAVATAGLFGGSTYAQTRTHLERLNETLVAHGSEPLTEAQITLASLGAGAIIGGGQAALGQFLRGAIGKEGAEAAKNALLTRFLPAGAQQLLAKVPGATTYVETALRDIPTFAGQAGATAGLERGVMSEQQIQALKDAGQEPPTALQATGAMVGPGAVAAIPGAIMRGVTQRPRPQPQGTSAETTAALGNTPAIAPESPAATAGIPGLRPRAGGPAGPEINPLTGQGIVESIAAPRAPTGAGETVNPLTGEQQLAPREAQLHPQTASLATDILQALEQNPYNQDAVDVAHAFLQETASEPGAGVVRHQVQQALQFSSDAGMAPTPSRVQIQATEPPALGANPLAPAATETAPVTEAAQQVPEVSRASQQGETRLPGEETLPHEQGQLSLPTPEAPTEPIASSQERAAATTEPLAPTGLPPSLDQLGRRLMDRLGPLQQFRESGLSDEQIHTGAMEGLRGTQGEEAVTKLQQQLDDAGLSGPTGITDLIDRIGAHDNGEIGNAGLSFEEEVRGPELQRMIRRLGGIQPTGSDIESKLRALFSPKETGTTGLFNTRSGLSADEMAQRLHDMGYLPTADTQALLTHLDASRRGAPQHQDYGPLGQLHVTTDTGNAQQPPLTQKDIRHAFPGQQIADDGDGTFTVTTKGGHTISIDAVSQITPTTAEIRLATGRATLSPGESVAGRISQEAPAIFRIEIGPDATHLTLLHEAGHFFEDAGLLTQGDIHALNRAVGRQGQEATPETRADFIAQAVSERAQQYQGPLGQIVRKVQGWFDKMAQAVGITTSGQVIRRIESGGVFDRPPVTDAAPADTGRLQVVTPPEGEQPKPGEEPRPENERPTMEFARGPGPATPRDVPGYQPRVVATELTHYNSFTKALPPEVLGKVQAAIADGRLRPFMREITTRPEIGGPADKIRADWRADPRIFQGFLDSLRRAGNSRRASAADEFQSRALRDLVNDQFLTMTAAHEAGVLSQAEYTDFLGKHSAADGLASFANMVRSTAGRTLGDLSSLTVPELYQQRLRELDAIKHMPEEDRARLLQKAHDALVAGDIERLRHLGDELPNPTWAQMYWRFFYGSNLSNPATMSRKAWSILSYQVFHNSLVKPLAAGLDSMVSAVRGVDRQLYTTGVLPELMGTLGRVPQAGREAWWLWTGNERAHAIPAIHFKEGFSTQEPQIKTGDWRRATWPSDISALGIKAGTPITFMRNLAPFIDASTRAFESMGVAFRHMGFDAQLEGLARNAAMRELGHADPVWEANWARNISEHPEAQQQAIETSKQLTMQDQRSTLANWLIEGRQKLPMPLGAIFQHLVPFVGTADRLIARGLELLPGTTVVPWAVKNTQWTGWLPKFNPQTAFTPENYMLLSKQILGTVMTASLYGLWHNGQITGAAPTDPAKRDAFYRQGMVPYSAKLGNQWVEWQQFHPLSLPLGAAVSAFEAMGRLAEHHADHPEIPTNVAYDMLAMGSVATQAMIGHVLEGSYFSGLASFFGSTQAGRESGDLPRGIMRNLVSATMPFIGLQRGIARELDSLGVVPGSAPGQTMVRQPQNLGEMFLANSVFASLVEPRRDVFGQPQSYAMTPLEGLPFAPPARRGVAIDTEMEQEFTRLDYHPGALSRTDALGTKYTPEDYRAMVDRRGALLEPQIQRMIMSAGWNRMSEEQQRQLLRQAVSSAGRQARRDVLKSRGQPEPAGVAE
jgi:hypothetical protein